MKSLRWGAVVMTIAVLGGALSTACHPTFVMVPAPGQDTVVDTVAVDGMPTRILRITRIDTVRDTRVDTVIRTRTLTRTDTVLRVDTVVRMDTVVRTRTNSRVDTVVRVDTLRLVRVDTVVREPARPPRTPLTGTPTQPPRIDTVRITVLDTLLRVDTVTVPVTRTVTVTDTVVRVDTVTVSVPRTVTVTDTFLRVDTLRLTRVDTLRIVQRDTVLVAGNRTLFVPPGHHPPEGQCRVWVHDLPPGRQADAAPCTGLGEIPAGAFILFAGDAWDFDYDWVWHAERNPGTVPPEIVAVKAKGKP